MTKEDIKAKVTRQGLLEPCTIIACKGTSFVSEGISLYSHSPYTHIDIVYMSQVVGGQPMHVLAGALKNGFVPTTFNSYWADDSLTDFDVLKIANLSSDRQLDMIRFMEKRLNVIKYDFRGIAHFLLPFIKPSNKRQFCSEIACNMFKAGCLLPCTFNSDSCKPSDLVALPFLHLSTK
jgi:hypothetical protein